MTEQDWFSTEEVRIEAHRLRRRHYYIHAGAAAIKATFSLSSTWILYMFLANKQIVWPTVVGASEHYPFGPEFFYLTTIAMMAVHTLVFATLAMVSWRRRRPLEGAYVEAALVRLSERGEL